MRVALADAEPGPQSLRESAQPSTAVPVTSDEIALAPGIVQVAPSDSTTSPAEGPFALPPVSRRTGDDDVLRGH
jgi:hypothetical protein